MNTRPARARRFSISCLYLLILVAAGLVGTQASGQTVTQVAAGNRISLFLTSDNTLWATGAGSSGQFGDGILTDLPDVENPFTYGIHRSTPVPVASDVASFAAGGQHTGFVKTDGTLWTTGWNQFGALGDGTTTHHNTPQQVASDVMSVSAGQYHTVFVKADGTLWGMGRNQFGQLGDRTFTDRVLPVLIDTGVASVAAGSNHTLWLRSDGTLWGAGLNDRGQLGVDPGDGNRNNPTFIASGVTRIAAGSAHSLFLSSDGTMRGMGENDRGELGDGTLLARHVTPIVVGTGIASFSAGLNHTLMLKQDGTLWATGSNFDGQLGDGSRDERRTPVQIATQVTAAAAGTNHSLFVKADGSLWAMGEGRFGQLGDNVTVADTPYSQLTPIRVLPPTVTLTLTSGATPFLEGVSAALERVAVDSTLVVASEIPALVKATVAITGNFKAAEDSLAFTNDGSMGNISGSYNSETGVLALTSAGATATVAHWQAALRAVTFGNSSEAPSTLERTVTFSMNNGAMSSPPVVKSITVADRNDGPTGISLSAGFVLRAEGASGFVGQLGSTDIDDTAFTYSLVDGAGATDNARFSISGNILRAKDPATLPAGTYSVRVQTDDGRGGTFAKVFSVVASAANDPAVVAMSAGNAHSLLLRSDQTLWATGESGLVFVNGGRATGVVPVQVASDVAAVSAGYRHTMYITTDGTLWAVGDNSFGQLGDGAFNARNVAVPVYSGVASVSGGGLTTMFVTTGGTLYGMGNNSSGGLGIGSTDRPNSPIFVTANVASVSTGPLHSVLIKTDGSLWGMGLNNYGQLGLGHTTDQLIPRQIATGVAAAVAGSNMTFFVKTDGSLWAAGYNEDGGLGDGTLINRSSPVQVATGVASVAASGHALFVKTDGTLWGTGSNARGQLGDGGTQSRSSPVQIATAVNAVVAGSRHTLFRKTDGSVWGMGANEAGQLGDGTLVDRNLPVRVLDPIERVATVETQPRNVTVAAGGRVDFQPSVRVTAVTTAQWYRNGVAISDATDRNLTVLPSDSASAGVYTLALTTPVGTVTSEPAILGVTTALKVVGDAEEIDRDIQHPNGNIYDQVLLRGTSATITADPGQVTRMSYVDLNDDIVQVEFSGAGSLTLSLENPSGPATAVNYQQPSVSYMKGHAHIVIAGANQTTNVGVFSVGRITAINQTLFKEDVVYDGVADLGSLAILASNANFEGVWMGDASFFGTRGFTGILAPLVQFGGPVYISDINGNATAQPVFELGASTDVRITGGDLAQANGLAVSVSGITQMRFVDGTKSSGALLPAQSNRAVLMEDGVDVTNQIVVNPP